MFSPQRLLIRPARTDDVEALVGFNLAMALETEGRRLDAYLLRQGVCAVLESPALGFYLMAQLPEEDSGAVVGQLLVTFEWSDWRNANFWWIQSVYVSPSWRRRGVYRRMYETVLHDARERTDVCGIRLYVEKDNEVAQSVYRTLNLQQTQYQIWEVDFVL